VKVFISWSGGISHKVALAFSDWLPEVIQHIEPFLSTEGIEKGTGWNAKLNQELAETRIGLFCLTHENLNSAWMNFEAGALSKALDNSVDNPRVLTFLFGINYSDVRWPLAQFQHTLYEKPDIYKLLQSLNNAAAPFSLRTDALERAFERLWSDLINQLDPIRAEAQQAAPLKELSGPITNVQILEELLELARRQFNIISSPEFQLRGAAAPGSVVLPRAEVRQVARTWRLFINAIVNYSSKDPYFIPGDLYDNISLLMGTMDNLLLSANLDEYATGPVREQITNKGSAHQAYLQAARTLEFLEREDQERAAHVDDGANHSEDG
jgi:hypothetical protein